MTAVAYYLNLNLPCQLESRCSGLTDSEAESEAAVIRVIICLHGLPQERHCSVLVPLACLAVTCTQPD